MYLGICFLASASELKKSDSQLSDDSDLPHFLSLETKLQKSELVESPLKLQKKLSQGAEKTLENDEPQRSSLLDCDLSDSSQGNSHIVSLDNKENNRQSQNVDSSSFQHRSDWEIFNCDSSQESFYSGGECNESPRTVDEEFVSSRREMGKECDNILDVSVRNLVKCKNGSLTEKFGKEMPPENEISSTSLPCHDTTEEPDVFQSLKVDKSKQEEPIRKHSRYEELCFSTKSEDSCTVLKQKSANLELFSDTELTLGLSSSSGVKYKREHSLDKENDRPSLHNDVAEISKKDAQQKVNHAATALFEKDRSRTLNTEKLDVFTLDFCDFSCIGEAEGKHRLTDTRVHGKVSEVPDSFWSLGTDSQVEGSDDRSENSCDFSLSNLSQDFCENESFESVANNTAACNMYKESIFEKRQSCEAMNSRKNSKRKLSDTDSLDSDVLEQNVMDKRRKLVSEDIIGDSYFTLSV